MNQLRFIIPSLPPHPIADFYTNFTKKIMGEDLEISKGSREEQYQLLIPQIKDLLTGEDDLVANMANLVAALKKQFGFLMLKNFHDILPAAACQNRRLWYP